MNWVRRCRTALVGLTAFAVPVVGQTVPPQVSGGSIVDSRGMPVAGTEIAQFWLAGSQTANGYRAYGAVSSDAAGKFQIKLDPQHLPATLFAIDSEKRQGAIKVVSEIGPEIRIQLQPLWQVHYRFDGAGLADLSKYRITVRPTAGSMFSQIVGSTEGKLLLPPGKYVLAVSSPGGGENVVNFEVATHDVILEPIGLTSGITQYYGHPAPALSDVEPVNVASFSSGELHGKWVLVYFWGYWCAPCVGEGLPKLARFFEQNPQYRGRFEIVAVHENGVAGPITVEELKGKLSGLEKNWGKPLPFPVVLDRSGQTIKTWGISAYPTIAIIKPNGELMAGDLETFRQELERK